MEDDVSPPTKLAKLTPWQVFLKDYGETEGKINVCIPHRCINWLSRYSRLINELGCTTV